MTFKTIFFRALAQTLKSHPKKNPVAIDLPAGNGETSQFLLDNGYAVHAFDLFPQFFNEKRIKCEYCDITEGIPLENELADLIICQEGIEHFPDQLSAFKEFNRVMKDQGTLIITTPNHSNLKHKLSYLLTESERYSRIMSVNEYDSIWFNRDHNDNQYYGHVFLIGITKMRLLARIAGFKIRKIHFSEVKPSNVFLFLIFYPFILLSSLMTYRRNVKKKPIAKATYLEILKLNIDPRILIDGSLIVEFEKEYSMAEAKKALHQIGSYDLQT
ncbi:MAG: class I SAM-dependent methyltransferase [Pseudobdellovibrionaceae bacterium]